MAAEPEAAPPPPRREDRSTVRAIDDPSRRFAALLATAGAFLSASLVPTLFFTLPGIMGLLVFGPGCLAAIAKRKQPVLERSRYVLACTGSLTVLSLFLHGFWEGSMTSTGRLGSILWIAVLAGLWLFSMFALVRLFRPSIS